MMRVSVLQLPVLIIALFFCILQSLFSSCTSVKHTSSMLTIPRDFDWQGHRGCRGLMPENTLVAFREALKYPVTTLELDVVISKDGELIVSHEPWMSHKICTGKDGAPITAAEKMQHNIYQLTRAEIQQYDCGSKGISRFPRQQKVQATKPTLAEVTEMVDNFCLSTGRTLPGYNIELKSDPSAYGIFIPRPEEFVSLVLREISHLQIAHRTILQSFDERVLLELHRRMIPDVRTSYLISRGRNADKAFEKLGFIPQILSPHHRLVSRKMVLAAHARQVKVIPWTVNNTKDFRKLIGLGVDGIITDYPDLIEQFP